MNGYHFSWFVRTTTWGEREGGREGEHMMKSGFIQMKRGAVDHPSLMGWVCMRWHCTCM
jgi:hypothetical protein